MTRTRFVTLTILVTLALGAGESSTALAHEWIDNGSAIAKGETVEVRGSGGIGLEAIVASLTTHIGCGEGLLPAGPSNVLEEAGKFKSKIELKACGVDIVSSGVEEDEPTCKILNFNVESTGELTESGIVNISGVGTEKVFGEIAISKVAGAEACALEGTFKLTGTATCDVPDYPVKSPGIAIGCSPPGGKEIKFDGVSTKLDLALGIEGAKGQAFSSN